MSHQGRFVFNTIKKTDGIILLSLFWLIIILLLVLLSQAKRVQILMEDSKECERQLQLRLAARSVTNQIMAGIAAKPTVSDTEGFDAFSSPWGYENLQSLFGQDLRESFPTTRLIARVEDEDSKINLSKCPLDQLSNLLKALGWTDLESEETARAFKEVSKHLENPPQEANGQGNFSSQGGANDLRYLLMCPSITSDVLFGADRRFDERQDQPRRVKPSKEAERLSSNLRMYGLSSFLTLCGDGVANPNLAPREALLTVPGVSEAIADEIISKRKGPDAIAGTDDDFVFKQISDLQSLHSASRFGEFEYNKMKAAMRTRSTHFAIKVCAVHEPTGEMHRIQTIIKREEGQVRILSRLEDTGF